MKTKTTLAALILFGAISAAFSSEIIKAERSEEFPDGKRFFTDYKRDGRLA